MVVLLVSVLTEEPFRAGQMETLQTCTEMEGMQNMHDAASKHHKDASATRMKNDVNKAMHTIEIWVNPFK